MARKKSEDIPVTNAVSKSVKSSNKAAKLPKTKKRRWYHQVFEAYKMTRQQGPSVVWWLLATFATVLAAAVIVGLIWGGGNGWGKVIYMSIIGVPTAVMAAMFVLARRAEKAAYARIEGEPGSSMAAVGTIRRGWTFEENPVAIDPRTRDLVFRGVGRPGVVLITEGPANRVSKLIEAERKRTARVLPNVPITIISVGREAGQVPLPKLVSKIRKLRPALNKHEVSVVLKRLTALGAVKLSIPKGVDPSRARPDRKGMRGR